MLTISRPTILGFAAAAATIGVALLLRKTLALDFFGALLGITAGVYLGFGLLDGRSKEIVIELVGVLIFLGLAVAGLKLWAYFLAAGFFLHGFWDAAHHAKGIRTKIARWWRPSCLAYDWIVGAFIVAWWR